jgi:hypothetical protein
MKFEVDVIPVTAAPIESSKNPAQFLSFVHNKVHFPSLYLVSYIPLAEGRAGTAWEPLETVISCLPSKKVLSLPATSTMFSLTLRALKGYINGLKHKRP